MTSELDKKQLNIDKDMRKERSIKFRQKNQLEKYLEGRVAI